MHDRAGKASIFVFHRHILGLTLVELMVALTIALIILAALTRLYATSRSTYTLEEGLARVQESGRFAVEFLSHDIRMAGYTGCSANLSSSAVNNLVASPTSATVFNPDGIRGYKPNCTTCTGSLSEWPGLPSEYFSSGVMPVGGTDILVIQRGDTVSTHLDGNLGTTNANIQIVSTASVAANLSANDIVMISDCKNIDVFKATSVSSGSGTTTITHTSGNTDNNLSTAYQSDAQIMKLVTHIYYIGRRNNDSNLAPSLFRKELDNGGSLTTAELVEGVEDMNLIYGEDTDSPGDGVVDIYRTPSSITNWKKVLSVRVGLLVRTANNVERAPDIRSYDLAGTSVGPFNDNLRRRAFNSTIMVRNHYHF
jgi:type IV pilus assembly protein PilW